MPNCLFYRRSRPAIPELDLLDEPTRISFRQRKSSKGPWPEIDDSVPCFKRNAVHPKQRIAHSSPSREQGTASGAVASIYLSTKFPVSKVTALETGMNANAGAPLPSTRLP
jgi:hypothetical protein